MRDTMLQTDKTKQQVEQPNVQVMPMSSRTSLGIGTAPLLQPQRPVREYVPQTLNSAIASMPMDRKSFYSRKRNNNGV